MNGSNRPPRPCRSRPSRTAAVAGVLWLVVVAVVGSRSSIRVLAAIRGVDDPGRPALVGRVVRDESPRPIPPGPAKARLGRRPELPPPGDLGPGAGPRGDLIAFDLARLAAAPGAARTPRIREAVAWLEDRYTLDANPGADPQRRGLYRYYLEFARAMTALNIDRIRHPEGCEHDWRAELADRLARAQRPDGSWTNPDEAAGRAEGGVMAVTTYAILTLQRIRESEAARPRAADRPRLP